MSNFLILQCPYDYNGQCQLSTDDKTIRQDYPLAPGQSVGLMATYASLIDYNTKANVPNVPTIGLALEQQLNNWYVNQGNIITRSKLCDPKAIGLDVFKKATSLADAQRLYALNVASCNLNG